MAPPFESEWWSAVLMNQQHWQSTKLHRVEFILGWVDAILGLTVTMLLALVVILSGPSISGITVVSLALAAHIGILLCARRHSRHTSNIAFWGLVVAIVIQYVIAIVGFTSFGLLFVPSMVLSVALLVVAFKQSWVESTMQ